MKGGPFFLALLVSAVAGCGGALGGAPTASVAPSSHGVVASGPTGLASVPAASGATISGRYADGLPRAIGGAPVLRGAAALAHAQAVTDDTPFLIGGWVTYLPGERFCPLRAADDTSWLHDCVKAQLGDVAGGEDPALAGAVTFRFALAGLTSGPVVASVEVHDPRAGECGSAAAACGRLMVVERIVWSGDEATDPRPLSADAVQRVLQEVQGTPDLTPFGPDSTMVGCGGQDLPAARLYLVPVEWDRVPAVILVEVEPSVAARARVLPLEPGPAAALGPAALLCTSFSSTPASSSADEYRWLALENVVLLVHTHHSPTAADRAFLDRLATALERAASARTSTQL